MRRAGFTLAEVLVVLVVLGIVATAVAPAIGGGGRRPPAAAAAEDARALLAGARREAVARGVPVVLALDTRSGRYRLDAEPGDGPPARPLAEGTLALPRGAAWDPPAGVRAFTFDALGAGHGGDLVVRGGGRVAVVEIDPWTGAVRAIVR